jgi:hypothetical protein
VGGHDARLSRLERVLGQGEPLLQVLGPEDAHEVRPARIDGRPVIYVITGVPQPVAER